MSLLIDEFATLPPLLPEWAPKAAGPKVLVVVAHPDDEYYCAAVLYRLTHELGGTADLAVLTNGEAGYRYSSLAERIYGRRLTEELLGRQALPAIRRRETLRAGRILGIRRHYFLKERDFQYTLDLEEALSLGWDAERIVRFLANRMRRERYDFVITVLPVTDTHGHHQTATLLALQAAGKNGPVVLGAEPARLADPVREFAANPGHPLLAAHPGGSVHTFDRRRSFGFRNELQYNIVVNWVIAEHKSQGAFQNDSGRHDCERYWVLGGREDAPTRAAELFALLNENGSEQVH
ncbi:MAG TPA: PIG-L family deacetylase [Bryobacteraceae bacterium]|nr:PIG-L family deacetylase [Bryobacteraceae bacterium]